MSQIMPHEVFKANGNTGVSSTNSYYSLPTDKTRVRIFGYQLFNNGTMAGTWEVYGTNKPNPVLTTDADWSLLDLPKPIIQPTAGAPASDYVDLSWAPWQKTRLKYTNISGTGTPEAYVSGN